MCAHCHSWCVCVQAVLVHWHLFLGTEMTSVLPFTAWVLMVMNLLSYNIKTA